MHEFSICQSLVQLVLDEMESRGLPPGSLISVRMAAGRMHQVVEDSMAFYYAALTEDTPARGSRLEIRFIDVQARCSSCGWSGILEPPRFVCRSCGSGDLDLTAGRELHLDAMEVQESCEGSASTEGPDLA